jgi:hypothetical protein
MKTFKRVWIPALCLLSATTITIGLRLHVTRVEAATRTAQAGLVLSSRPVAHFANTSLRATVPNAILLDDDGSPTRVEGNGQTGRLVFPPVEQFTLTPSNPAQHFGKTALAVRFGTGAERLPSEILMTLGSQHVTVQRSGEDPNTYIAAINFDWQTFASEQEQRKQAAAAGKMVAVFSGRKFVRMEPMEFMDPAQIQGALQSHQPLELSPGMLTDGPISIVPDHELMITAIPVVEDPQRTSDPCLPSTLLAPGAWTFAKLMEAIACSTGSNNCTQQAAENMLLSMLSAWQSTQTVNTFQVGPRNIGVLGQSGLLGNWPLDSSGVVCTTPTGQQSPCPSLPNAPVHLLAIANRIDIGQNSPPFPAAGELRFVFGVAAGTSFNGTAQPCSNSGNQAFTIILEYHVPSRFSATQWANVWNSLEENGTFDATYRNELQSTITDQVVTAGACTNSSGQAVSCISQIRTNEVEISNNGLWEQRQFQLVPSSFPNRPPQLNMGTVSMTPDGSFNADGQPSCAPNCNTSGDVGHWINANVNQILQTGGALPIVPAVLSNGDHFLGGSAFNNGSAFWVDGVQLTSEPARIDFSLNTCNACHGGETATRFLQIQNRAATGSGDQPAALSNFLLGCSDGGDTCTPSNGQCALNAPCQEKVTDPNPPHQIQTAFGDILRRQAYMSGLISSGSGSGGMLLPFLSQPLGVH